MGVCWSVDRRCGGSLNIRANASSYDNGLLFPDFGDTDFSSDIQQAQIRADLDTRPSRYWGVQVGSSVERMEYETSFSTGGTNFGGGDSRGWLFGNYAQARYSLPRRWLVELGVRADAYNPGVGNIVFEPSPRLALKRFYRNGDLAAKVAAGRYTQLDHSLRDEELPLGLDIWIISDENVPHTVSDQVQFGLEGWHDIDWFWSIEGYYRSFNGVVTFNTADNPNDANTLMNNILEDMETGTARLKAGLSALTSHSGTDASNIAAIGY